MIQTLSSRREVSGKKCYPPSKPSNFLVVYAEFDSNRDQEICDRLKLYIKERGLIFVGIDIIGDFLIEINVTSPTGIQEINRLNNLSLEKDIWDAIEVKISK